MSEIEPKLAVAALRQGVRVRNRRFVCVPLSRFVHRTFLWFYTLFMSELLRRSAEPLAVPGVHDLRAEDVPAVGVQVRRRVELRARHEPRAGGRGAQEGRRRDEATV